MKRMRLFEVGFKEKAHASSYSEKFYIAADSGEEAIEKGRKWLVEDALRWWVGDGELDAQLDLLEAELGKVEEANEGEIPDGWIEKRFDESPPLQAALAKNKREHLAIYENMHLARVYDEGTLII